MADQVLGEALLEIRASQEKLVGDVAKIADTLVGALQKVEKQTESAGLSGLAKEIQEVARATDAAEKQIQNLKFAAIADEVGQLTSALKGAESGVQITEDLAKAESLLEERFGLVRAEIQRQAEAQRGLVDEETLLERTTLQLEAAQRQHDAALATVRGRAIQAAEGIAQLEQEEQASALAAQQSWEAVGKLAIEQEKAEQSARELAAQEAKLAADAERSAAQAKANKEAWEGAKTAYGLVSKAAVAVGTALLATEAAAVALTVKTVEQGDELNRLSDQYGVAVTTLAGMKQAFKDNELEAGDLNTALRQFSNVLGEAMAGGDKATATVEALGISTAKLKDGTLSTEDAFRIAIDSLSKMENGYGKAAISQDLFGRAGSKIPGIFKDGAKSIDAASASAMAMGNSFTEVEQQAVAKLDDAMDELSDRVAGLGASIGKELMPVAADIVREANEWIKANRELIQQDVKSFALGIRDAMKDLLPLVQHVAEALGFVGDVIAGISGPAAQSFAALRAEEARLVEETKGAEEVFRLFHPLTKELGDSADYAGMRYKSLQAQLAVVREKIAATLDPTKKAKATLADLQKVTDDEADAATRAGEANDKLPPPIIKTGDAAGKAAKKLEEQANALAEAAQKSAAFAQSQIEVAAQTGDATRVQDAYTVAMAAAGLAYQKAMAAADAAARSGKSAAEVQAMQTEAFEQYATTVNGNAEKVGAFYAKQEKDLRALAVAQSDLAIANDMEALSAANAQQVDAVFQKTIEDITAAHDAAVEAIEAKRGVTLSAAEADLELMRADEKTRGELKQAEEQFKRTKEAADVFGRALDDLAEGLASATLDLGFALLQGKESWKDAARQLAAEFGRDAISELKQILMPGVKDLFKGLASTAVQGFGSLFGSLVPDEIGPAIAGAATNQAAVQGALSAGTTMGTTAATGVGAGLAAALSSTGVLAVVAAGATILGTGISKVITSETSNGIKQGARMIAGVTFPFVGIVVEQILEAFGLIGPNMEHRIADWFARNIGKSLQDPEVQTAVEEGARAIGESVGMSLVKAMTHIPVKEIHKGIHDVVTEAFAGESAAVQTEIQQLALAAGTAVAAQMGYVGSQAIAFSQAWASSWIRAQVQAGKSTEQIIKELEAMDKSLGTSGGIFAALDALNAKIIETGKSGEVFKDLSATVKDWTGKKTDVQSFSDVLAAFGGDAVLTLNAIKKALEDNGIAVEQFGDDLGDVVLAFTGAGESIQAAADDYREFGNEADGTGEILRNKVLSGLDDVIATAKDFPVESVQAFASAVSLIPPEMLRSSEFVNALREDFARMAAESHMSVQELVDSIDPPLPEATRNAILAVNDLGKAIGDLTGAPLKSLKEVTDRMKQFGSEMYREVKDADGKVIRELTAFGQELIDEASTAISGMWSQMNEDGWVGLDEIGVMFDQLALLPVEALNDPAIQQATRDLLAKIGAMTGDAAIIAMANAETITQDMIDQGLAAYDEYKKEIADNPPEVPPPTTPDGQPVDPNAPTGGPPDTTAAGNTPPPQPIPPETQASWDALTASATAYATAVVEGRDAVEALSQGTVAASAKILAAIQPIYGTPDDDVSLSAIHEKLKNITDDLLGWSGNWKDDFDKARGAVIDLTTEVGNYAGALAAIPTDITTTITAQYVTEGAPLPTPEAPPPPMASGGWIPGALGAPFEITAHGRELVVPAETATTLPPDLVAQLLSGDAFTLPASMVARLSGPVVAPMVDVRGASQGGGGAPARPSSRAFEARIFSDREIGERAVVYIERQVGDGYVETGGGFKVHPMIHGKVGAR